jgi:hypothetical protein
MDIYHRCPAVWPKAGKLFRELIFHGYDIFRLHTIPRRTLAQAGMTAELHAVIVASIERLWAGGSHS